jgi:hypothetical protein
MRCLCLCVCVIVCLCDCVIVCLCVCMFVCLYVCVVCLCVCVFVCVRTDDGREQVCRFLLGQKEGAQEKGEGDGDREGEGGCRVNLGDITCVKVRCEISATTRPRGPTMNPAHPCEPQAQYRH